MVSGTYDVLKVDLYDGSVDLAAGGDTIKVALLDGTASFTAGNSVLTDVIATPGNAPEISGGGYTNGGETLLNQIVSLAANTATFNGDDTEWTSATFTTNFALIYDTGNTDSLMHLIDFSGPQSVTAGTFTIVWNVLGISTIA